ncbi:MAG TPA: hypothetical protein VFZ48_03370 [Candidatus Saccharimonadales bacterium]
MQKIKQLFAYRPSKKATLYIIGGVLFVGVLLRLLVMLRGHNFDYQSYTIVGDIVLGGGNVYALTPRYNYGPAWFTILGAFRGIGQLFNNQEVFRVLIVLLLTAVDVAIAFLLRRKFGLLAFALFFLNPVTIVITGYHNQFDSLAILVGLLGLMVLPPDTTKKLEKRHVYSALLIGLSLVIKHIFFILPVWLFIRGATLKIKLFMLFVPVAIFLFSFLPFWAGGEYGIMQNVFLYKSFPNAPLINMLFSVDIVKLINPTFLLVGALVVTGFLTRKLPRFEAALWYLVVLVAFSPAIANQYLAIAMPAAAAFGMIFFVPYIIFASLLLFITSENGLHINRFLDNIPPDLLRWLIPTAKSGPLGQYRLIIFSLFVALVVAAIYRYRRQWLVRPARAVKKAIVEQYHGLRR